MKSTLLLSSVLLISSFGFGQLNMTQLSNYTFPPGVELANLWGYSDGSGKEYALVGTTTGLSIIDVTDPLDPQLVDTVPGPASMWREVRTWQNYAYVTTEGGSGLVIVDLSDLPYSINYKNWTGTGDIAGLLNTIHTVHIDNGYAYIYGSNLANGGAVIADLSDPWNPVYVGEYNGSYIHDGIVRKDTLWGSHVYKGYFSAIDVRDKTNPVLLQTQNTPGNFTHNSWLSDNSKVLFTTDEIDNSFLTAYDITDIENIKELDRIQSNPGSNSIVHNTHILNDYAITSWYRDGVVIVDGQRPENLVIVGSFDTSPLSGGGFNGCWGVYPYLPSGNILASDMENGLFVLSFDNARAAYLEGVVTDSLCGTPLQNVTVQITGTDASAKTGFTGEYKTGIPLSGTYDVTFSCPGYKSKTVSGVNFVPGNLILLDMKLYSISTINVSGTVRDKEGVGMDKSFVLIENADNSYNLTSDNNGGFTKCNLLEGSYEVTKGKWGYVSNCKVETIDALNNLLDSELQPGFYDDFTFNYGWTESGSALSGKWKRARPSGAFFPADPYADVSADCSVKAFVTGNDGGEADLDAGRTIITSPVFDLTNYIDPVLSYYRWFHNAGSSFPNDSLIVRIDNGRSTAVIEVVTGSSAGNSSWLKKTYRIKDYIIPTATMTVSFEAVDASPDHTVEAGVDKFEITGEIVSGNKGSGNTDVLTLFPNPFNETAFASYKLKEEIQAGAKIIMLDLTGRVIFEKAIIRKEDTVILNVKPAAGFYFVKIINGKEEAQVAKLIKMK